MIKKEQKRDRKNLLAEFKTNNNSKIALFMYRNKYYIEITESKKKGKGRRVFESLNHDKAESHFFALCKHLIIL